MHQVLVNIRTLRELKGLSQEYLADCLDMTQSSYARFENEAKKIDYKTIEKVANVFKVTPVTLITFHENQKYLQDLSPDLLRENTEAYLNYSRDTAALKERVNYLEQVNDLLKKQLNDKEEIIDLLRAAKKS